MQNENRGKIIASGAKQEKHHILRAFPIVWIRRSYYSCCQNQRKELIMCNVQKHNIIFILFAIEKCQTDVLQLLGHLGSPPILAQSHKRPTRKCAFVFNKICGANFNEEILQKFLIIILMNKVTIYEGVGDLRHCIFVSFWSKQLYFFNMFFRCFFRVD